MLKFKDRQVTIKDLEAKVCDICGVIIEDKPENYAEIQEFVHLSFIGGYGSIFGDGTKVSIDVCQHCVKKLLGSYLKFNDPE